MSDKFYLFRNLEMNNRVNEIVYSAQSQMHVRTRGQACTCLQQYFTCTFQPHIVLITISSHHVSVTVLYTFVILQTSDVTQYRWHTAVSIPWSEEFVAFWLTNWLDNTSVRKVWENNSLLISRLTLPKIFLVLQIILPPASCKPKKLTKHASCLAVNILNAYSSI